MSSRLLKEALERSLGSTLAPRVPRSAGGSQMIGVASRRGQGYRDSINVKAFSPVFSLFKGMEPQNQLLGSGIAW